MAWRRMTTSVVDLIVDIVVVDDVVVVVVVVVGDGVDAWTWTVAENRCRRLGMSLATPEEL